MWVAMTEMYGTRWTSQYGDEPLPAWRAGLSDLSASQIGAGIMACRNSGNEWPPSLPEFRALAKPNRPPYYRDDNVKQLPQKQSAPEKGREEIAKLKALLSRAKNIGALPYDKTASAAEIESGTKDIHAAKLNAMEAAAEWLAKRA